MKTEPYFKRQLMLPEFGAEGQQKLQAATVLVVGAGGLGCPVLQYLAAAGTGHIRVMDHDVVADHNLHRQILFGVDDIGKNKAACAAGKLATMYPWTTFTPRETFLNHENARHVAAGVDVVVDCTDNFNARYLVNDLCVTLGIPFVSASIVGFKGQLSVYNFQDGPTYRCIFPEPPQDAETCASAGVIGALAGIMGTMQAMETIKVISGAGEPLTGKLYTLDALTGQSHLLQFDRQVAKGRHDLLSHYEEKVSGISGEAILIDVSEPWEHEEMNLSGTNIPLAGLPQALAELDPGAHYMLYCRNGTRSRIAAALLAEAGFKHVTSFALHELNTHA